MTELLDQARAAFKAGAHTRGALCAALNIPEGSFAARFEMSFGEFVDSLVDTLAPDELLGAGAARANQGLRKHQTLAAAIHLSRGDGRSYARITRGEVAAMTCMSASNVARLYSMPDLRADVVRYALAHKDAQILAQARVYGDPLLD